MNDVAFLPCKLLWVKYDPFTNAKPFSIYIVQHPNPKLTKSTHYPSFWGGPGRRIDAYVRGGTI
jgi:hypothetical protein